MRITVRRAFAGKGIFARSIVMVLLAAAMVPAASRASLAQRNANVWDGKDHQPTEGAVDAEERAAGVRPGPGRDQRLNEEVDQTARRLLQQEEQSTGNAPRRP
jgi:hypothetical protein